jgi:hypothetical protein
MKSGWFQGDVNDNRRVDHHLYRVGQLRPTHRGKLPGHDHLERLQRRNQDVDADADLWRSHVDDDHHIRREREPTDDREYHGGESDDNLR